MTIDWEELARSFGSIQETDIGRTESSGSDMARMTLSKLLGDDEIIAAVHHYLSRRPGCELARSVLWLLRPNAAMLECYRSYRESPDPEIRMWALDLLAVVADESALQWVSEFLSDEDPAIQTGGMKVVDQLAMAKLIELDEAEPYLARAAVHPNPAIRERAAFIRTLFD